MAKSVKPLISFYSATYKQKKFLRGYFENVLNMADFDKCELVLVRSRTLDDEENDIYAYYDKYKNIKIITLDYDPGLYASWNIAINHCQSDILSNANTDDRRERDCINAVLAEIKDYDIVYSDYNIAFDTIQLDYSFLCPKRSLLPEYSVGDMIKYCLCGPTPFWRKSLFDKVGFRTDLDSVADLEFWLRCIRKGAKIKKINEVLSTYYFNPKGASTNSSKEQKRSAIESEIKRQYAQVLYYSGPLTGELDYIWIPK